MEELKFSEHTLNPFNYNNMKSKVIAVMMSMFVFSPEDGGSLFLRNVRIYNMTKLYVGRNLFGNKSVDNWNFIKINILF
jgi:hypothetical protein